MQLFGIRGPFKGARELRSPWTSIVGGVPCAILDVMTPTIGARYPAFSPQIQWTNRWGLGGFEHVIHFPPPNLLVIQNWISIISHKSHHPSPNTSTREPDMLAGVSVTTTNNYMSIPHFPRTLGLGQHPRVCLIHSTQQPTDKTRCIPSSPAINHVSI